MIEAELKSKVELTGQRYKGRILTKIDSVITLSHCIFDIVELIKNDGILLNKICAR